MNYETYPLHNSMRGYFTRELYMAMKGNDDIILLTGDLGFGQFDHIQRDFPDRFFNVGAAEQTLLDIAVGIAQAGKIPFCYSITPFLIYRPFETIRTYINHEKVNVKLIGGGRDYDYSHDGISHHAHDVKKILSTQENIAQHYPKEKEEVGTYLTNMINHYGPEFISLSR